MTRATLHDLAVIRRHGYAVEPLDSGHGPAPGAWILRDPDGSPLMIGSHGCVAPTQWEAVAEGLTRIDRDGSQ